jgi:hypothetical protein
VTYRYHVKRARGWRSRAGGRKGSRRGIFGNPFTEGSNAEPDLDQLAAAYNFDQDRQDELRTLKIQLAGQGDSQP